MLQLTPQLFLAYWGWYYGTQVRRLWRAWRNFLWFGQYFFSIPLLIRTLLAPFRRYTESYGRGFQPVKWTEAAFMNAIYRILGAAVRLVIIAAGVIFEVLTFVIGALIMLLWLAMPVLLIASFVFSLSLLA